MVACAGAGGGGVGCVAAGGRPSAQRAGNGGPSCHLCGRWAGAECGRWVGSVGVMLWCNEGGAAIASLITPHHDSSAFSTHSEWQRAKACAWTQKLCTCCYVITFITCFCGPGAVAAHLRSSMLARPDGGRAHTLLAEAECCGVHTGVWGGQGAHFCGEGLSRGAETAVVLQSVGQQWEVLALKGARPLLQTPRCVQVYSS